MSNIRICINSRLPDLAQYHSNRTCRLRSSLLIQAPAQYAFHSRLVKPNFPTLLRARAQRARQRLNFHPNISLTKTDPTRGDHVTFFLIQKALNPARTWFPVPFTTWTRLLPFLNSNHDQTSRPNLSHPTTAPWPRNSQATRASPSSSLKKINIAPALPTAFSTPAALESHLDANLPLPTTLTITISTGTFTEESCSRVFAIHDGYQLCDTRFITTLQTEIQAWANLLVRMTKAPSFDVRRLTLDMRPRKEWYPTRDFFKLLTRVTAAIWQAGKRAGQVEKCVLVVKGWTEHPEGSEENLNRYCVGVGVKTVNTVEMGKKGEGNEGGEETEVEIVEG